MKSEQGKQIMDSIHSPNLRLNKREMGGGSTDNPTCPVLVENVDQTTILVKALEEKLELGDIQKQEIKKGLGELLNGSARDSSTTVPVNSSFWDQLLKESFGREESEQKAMGREKNMELLRRATVLHLMYRILTTEQRFELVKNLK